MKDALRKTGFVALPVIIIIGLIAYFTASGAKTSVPANFTTARQNASEVGQEIVALTNTVNQKIQAANAAENQGNVNGITFSVRSAFVVRNACR